MTVYKTVYKVDISEEFVHSVVLEAASKEEAVQKAYELVGNEPREFLEKNNEYELEAVGFITDGYDVREQE